MAGITAIASTGSHAASGATASTTGFIAGETVELTASPTGTDYLWSLAAPAGSNAARVGFAGSDESTASFTPDVSGTWLVAATVDGTVYTLSIAVLNIAATNSLEAIRLSPIADSQIPTPSGGGTLYWSSNRDSLSLKDSEGTVFTVDVTEV